MTDKSGIRKKIIFTDVDGTLYDYDNVLQPTAVKAIRLLRDKSHLVYMVTGRSKAENKKELWDIGFDGMIGGNGCYIESEGQVILHDTFSLKQCSSFVGWCKSRGIEFYEETNEGLFTSPGFMERVVPVMRQYMADKDTSPVIDEAYVRKTFHGLKEGEELCRDDVNKISFILNSYDDYLEAKKSFPGLKVSTWGGQDEKALFGDIGLDTDKAKAIEILLDHLGMTKEDAIALGDAKADIPMLEYCGVGITFASGGREIKAMADMVSDDVADDGFYKAFVRLGLIEDDE